MHPGRDFPMSERFYWSRYGVAARFPDTGQMNDGIGIANRDATQRVLAKKELWTETIDAEAPGEAKVPADIADSQSADDAPEDIAS